MKLISWAVPIICLLFIAAVVFVACGAVILGVWVDIAQQLKDVIG